jgi:hypothetical protein
MSPYLNASVTLFRGAQNTVPIGHPPLRDVLENIQRGTWQYYTSQLRRLKVAGDEDAYKTAKAQSVAFTPCCDLHTRAKDVPLTEKLLGWNRTVHFDMDHLTDPDGMKALLAQNPQILYAFMSPSGAGVKFGVPVQGVTSPHDYPQAWRTVLTVLKQQFTDASFSEDTHIKYITALCFVSHDPALYLNDQALPVVIPPSGATPRMFSPRPRRQELSADDEYARVAAALDSIPNHDADYDVWLSIGMALQSSGVAGARALWDWWSRQSAKFDEGKQARKWASFRSDGAITLGTLFYLAQQHGWQPPQQILPPSRKERQSPRMWIRPASAVLSPIPTVNAQEVSSWRQ